MKVHPMTTDAILFISQGRIGVVRPDGSDERYFEFDAPPQNSWQLTAVLGGGRRAILQSQDFPRDPKADFYSEEGFKGARSHLWLYDFATKRLEELDVPDGAVVAGVLPGERRLLISGNVDWNLHLYTVDLHGLKRRDIAQSPGFGYGTSLSPDGKQAAFHICGRTPKTAYEIFTVDLQTGKLQVVASNPKSLYFGPVWSADGEWLLYQDCHHRTDPGHDRSNVCLGRPDGSEHRVVTTGQAHWCAASYGYPGNHGNGTNCPVWTRDGKAVTFIRVVRGSREPWQYNVGERDTDHFNRSYRIEEAHGGTKICQLDRESGEVTVISREKKPTWNFRLLWSPDGKRLAFCRAVAGGSPAVYVMDADGTNERCVTRGLERKGADHPRWFMVDERVFAGGGKAGARRRAHRKSKHSTKEYLSPSKR